MPWHTLAGSAWTLARASFCCVPLPAFRPAPTPCTLHLQAVDTAVAGQSVAMKIEACNTEQGSRLYGRHFDHTDPLISKISRESINALKAHFADQMSKEDWRLVVKLKKVFGVN